MTAGEAPAVQVTDLRMRYGDKDVLLGVDLTVNRGEILALLGPNGAGKTTTIEVLEGFRKRSAGEVSVLGVDPAVGDEAWRARVGIVLQSWRDHGKWRVRQFLANQGSLYAPFSTPQVPRPWDVDDLLARWSDRPGRCPGSAPVRWATSAARCRCRSGRTPGSAVPRRAHRWPGSPGPQGLSRPAARRGDDFEVTVLITTHDLAEADKVADRIAILVAGRVIAEGTPKQLSRMIAGHDRVRWVRDGRRFEEKTLDSTAFVRALLATTGGR